MEYCEELYHMARLSLTGRRQDILSYIRRLARKYAGDDGLDNKLLGLLKDAPTEESPIRGAAITSIPVDQDSRLNLVRYEEPKDLDFNPIWNEAVKGSLDQFINERKKEYALISAGLSPSKSMLCHGTPGVGKTLAARWIANKLNRPLLTLDLSAVISSYLGRTGINIRHVLDYAKGFDCVLMLDELDAIAKRRDDSGEIGELKRLVTVLLQEIDDWPESGVLLAATNHPSLLDPAVWRRFDNVIEFVGPDINDISLVLKEYLGKQNLDDDKRLCLAFLYEGSSYSDIHRNILELRRKAILANLDLNDVFVEHIKQQCAELPKKSRKTIATKLISGGYTQRKASELTGVSRVTIRKSLNE